MGYLKRGSSRPGGPIADGERGPESLSSEKGSKTLFRLALGGANRSIITRPPRPTRLKENKRLKGQAIGLMCIDVALYLRIRPR